MNMICFNYVGTYNKKPYSVLTNKKEISFSYDILEMKYSMSTTIIWFAKYWRRRKNEQISICAKKIPILVNIEEINSLPIFATKFGNIEDIEMKCEMISEYVNKEPKVLEALLKKYIKNFTSKMLDETYCGRAVEVERYCSEDDLSKKFKEEYNAQNLTDEEINNCILFD